jgi:hypothetical protein
VFLRADFEDLGGYDQAGCVLRKIVREGRLVRVGPGSTRARPSITSGEPVPARGLTTLTEALGRVGIKRVPTRLERAYNAGETTQVPTGRVVGVTRRVRRKVGYADAVAGFERRDAGFLQHAHVTENVAEIVAAGDEAETALVLPVFDPAAKGQLLGHGS